MKEVQIYFIKWVLWLRVITFLFVSIFASYVFILALDEKNDAPPIILVCFLVLAILYLLFVTLFTDIKRLRKSEEPALIVDEAGIYLHSSNPINGFIPWQDVKEFNTEDRGIGRKYIYLVLHNPSEYIKQIKNPIFILLSYILKFFKSSPITIEVSPLNIKIDELTSILISYWQNAHVEE